MVYWKWARRKRNQPGFPSLSHWENITVSRHDKNFSLGKCDLVLQAELVTQVTPRELWATERGKGRKEERKKRDGGRRRNTLQHQQPLALTALQHKNSPLSKNRSTGDRVIGPSLNSKGDINPGKGRWWKDHLIPFFLTSHSSASLEISKLKGPVNYCGNNTNWHKLSDCKIIRSRWKSDM